MIAAKSEANHQKHKDDAINLLILIFIASTIGIYLIATAVLIAKDGVFYIERAQKFSSDPVGIIKGHPFGYPFLIFITHKLVTLFTNGSSLYSWIYSAQSVNLLCRIFSFIPLYFIGKILVGPRNSFWALLILAFLPYPTEFGSDALRDWAHVFFLACGFWAILWGAKKRNWWIFVLAGLSAGLGYTVRPVCVQLVVYGMIWLGYCFLRPAKTMARKRTALAVVVILLGFLLPVGPYTVVKGKMLPEKLYPIIQSFSLDAGTNTTAKSDVHSHKTSVGYIEGISNKIFEAAGNLVEKASANLMWFFVLPLLVGIYYHFQKIATQEEKLLVTALIGLNIIFLFLRYCYVNRDLTHRYIMSLTIFTIFYIPTGLKLLSCWIVNAKQRDKLTVTIPSGKAQKLFYVLLIIGLSICLPKLLRPIRIEKEGYRSAAKWLRENTAREDVVAAPDRRLYFYAERNGFIFEAGKVAAHAKYVVKIIRSEDEELNFGGAARKEHSVWVDKRKKRKKLVIYSMLGQG
ncbi:MAG: ArnT family glycosyltransferase [Planctomycetota bacterium]|jgi:hypothetical protein